MRSARHLVIFARQPRAGTSKRRLAKDIGSAEATRFQRSVLAALLRKMSNDPRWNTWLAVTPDRSGPWPSNVSILAQGPGDLGQRMKRIFVRLPIGPAVIIGSDIPDISVRHVALAFKALGGHDAVIGPAPDGGYWLIGLRRAPRLIDPFPGVRWSTEHALADTFGNLRRYSVAQLELLEDVDDAADLMRYRKRHASRAAIRPDFSDPVC